MATSPNISLPRTSEPIRLIPADQVHELVKLQKAAQKITSILDLDELIEQIAVHVAGSFGCVETNIYLHEPEQGEMVLAGTHGCTMSCKGTRLKVGKEGMVGYVAATGQMRYAPDVSQDPYYMACEESTQSEVAIPLHVEQNLIGVLTASHPDRDAFSPEQLRLLQGLCSHIAVAVRNARRFQQERNEREKMTREAQEARAIQQALLPRSSPFIPGFALTGLSIPAGAVGGDWYDFIDLGDGRWGLVLADVSGKGMAAALLMSATRAMLRSLAENQCSPGEVLTRLNQLLVEDFPSGRFVTMVYGVFDPAQRRLTFANAGHLPPLVVDGGEPRFIATEAGLPLGVARGCFSEVGVDLPPGSCILLYSDGITEAGGADDEEYGAARLSAHMQRPDACLGNLLEDVRAFTNGSGLRDDATAIMLKA